MASGPPSDSVGYWWPDQDEAAQTAAAKAVQLEVVNHLKTIGLYLNLPGLDSGCEQYDTENCKVVQFKTPESYDEIMFRDEAQAIDFHFTSTDGSHGYMVACHGAGTSLDVAAVKVDGVLAAHAARKKNLPPHPVAANQSRFTIGDIYAGAGYFNDPHAAEFETGTGPARQFLTPLAGLVITVQFHPTKTTNCLGNTRRFSNIIYYRVDGLFSTTFSTSWQACGRLEP